MKKYTKRLVSLLLALVIAGSVLSPGFLTSYAQVTTDTPEKFDAVLSDDFEDFDTSKSYWTGTVTKMTEGTNSYVSIQNKGPAKSGYFSEYLRPTKMSFSAKAMGGENGLFLAIPGLDANDAPATLYKGLWNYAFSGVGHGLWGYGAVNPNGSTNGNRIFNNSLNNNATSDSGKLAFKLGEWFHVDAEFDYSDWGDSRSVSVTYVITGKIYGIRSGDVYVYDDPDAVYEKDGKQYRIGDSFTMDAVTYRYVFKGAEYDAPVSFVIGNPNTGSATLCIDDYEAQYDYTHGNVSRYTNTHAGALDGTDTTALALEAAVNAYFALSAEEKAVVDTHFAGGVERLTDFLAANPSPAASQYKTQYGNVLVLTAGSITPASQGAVTTAMQAYEALGEREKLTLKAEYYHLQALQTAIDYYVVPREEDDFSDWTEDFESGNLKNWELEYDHSGNDKNYHWYVDADVITDPDDPANKVLKVEQAGGYRLHIKDSTWPPLGAMQTVSYRFKGMPGLNNSYRHKIFTWYIDEENYSYISISGENSTYLVTVIDGQSKEEARSLETPLVVTDWLDVIIVYDQAKAGYSATIVDCEGTAVVWGGSLKNASGRFVLGQQKNAMFGDGHYVDDIRITLAKGDWDLDDEISQLEVYYDANVWMEPGDIVTISGESLGSLTQKLQLIRIPDTADFSQVFYPGQQSYKYNPDFDTNGQKKSIEELLTLYTFEDGDTVDIVQRTVDSVKFRIPENLKQGIYAVKLTNASAGADTLVFINRPHMSQVWGGDAGAAALGTDLRVIGRKMMLSTDSMGSTRIALVNPSTKEIVHIAAPERVDDIYSAHITLPDDIPAGDYLVYFHNGYGDNNMWSDAGKITVTQLDLRSTWSQTVFDVTDYGAVSDIEVNSTPAFVAALDAAAQNGGGIVYVPAGTYAVIHTLVIPQKDITYVTNWLLGKVDIAQEELSSFTQRADINGDTVVDLRDVNLLRKALLLGWDNVELPSVTPVTYNVVFWSDGGQVGSKDYAAGDLYGTLPAVSKAGYSLKGWYYNTEGTGAAVTPSTAVKQESHTVYAVWTEDQSSGGELGGELVPDEDVFD